MAAVEIDFSQYGHFDSFSIVRSTSPMSVTSLPTPIVENLKTMHYLDTTVIPGATYYYRAIAKLGTQIEVSDELEIVCVDRLVTRLSFSTSGTVDARTKVVYSWYGTSTYASNYVNLPGSVWADIASSAQFDFGAKDFSIIHEVYLTNLSSWRILLSGKYYTSGYVQYGFASGYLYFSDDFNGIGTISASTAVTVNTWVKTELRRVGTLLSILINDVTVASVTILSTNLINFNPNNNGTRLFNITWSSENSPIIGRCSKFEVSCTP